MIRAIETVFDGHSFRSRLEARWAVFFKEASLLYQYEPEGYEVGGGVRYLPDFYLDEICNGIHVEVKPSRDLLDDKDIEKLIRFSGDNGQRLLLIVGTPCSEEMFLLTRGCIAEWAWYEQEAKEGDSTLRELFFGDIEFSEVIFGHIPSGPNAMTLLWKEQPGALAAHFTEAREKARQARFEHGRSGN